MKTFSRRNIIKNSAAAAGGLIIIGKGLRAFAQAPAPAAAPVPSAPAVPSVQAPSVPGTVPAPNVPSVAPPPTVQSSQTPIQQGPQTGLFTPGANLEGSFGQGFFANPGYFQSNYNTASSSGFFQNGYSNSPSIFSPGYFQPLYY